MTDLDQSGQSYQWLQVYMGPSMGWIMVRVKPQTSVTATPYTVQPGDSQLLVNLAAPVTINLPLASDWVKYAFARPGEAFERSLWIKDFGGNAAANNITIHPSGSDKIDNLAQDFVIVQNRQLLRLYPLNDLTGWYTG